MWNTAASSKLCFEKNIVNNHMKHVNNLVKAKSRIDTSAPYQPQFIKSRAKQKKTQMEKGAKIQQDNQILLDKMMRIEKKPGDLNSGVLHRTYRKEHTHGNTTLRANNMKTINEENKKMLNRLYSTNATYKKRDWDKDAQQNGQFLENISKNARRKSHVNFGESKYGMNQSRSYGTLQNTFYSNNQQNNLSKQKQYDYEADNQNNSRSNGFSQQQRINRPQTATNVNNVVGFPRPNTSGGNRQNYNNSQNDNYY